MPDPVGSKVSFESVTSASYRINSGIRKTPCEFSKMLSEQLGFDVYLKREYMQVTGSFKERGALNVLKTLSEERKKKGVIAASAGNHALALSYHGQKLGIPVIVCMPINAPVTKVQNCRKFNAMVEQVGSDILAAKEYGLAQAEVHGYYYVNGYDNLDIIAGQGTIGLEIIEQVPDIDACVIPVGGGGLIAGVAVALKSLKPSIKIIGVQSELCPSLYAAMEQGHPVKVDAIQALTLADGLCVPKVGDNAFATLDGLVDQVILVKENFIAMAVLRLIEMEKSVVEGAGAVGLAAGLDGQLESLKGKKVVFLLCGGNIDATCLGRVIERGLAADGRYLRFSVTVIDRPGGICELVQLIASLGVSIKDITHERAWIKSSVYTVEIKCAVEVRNHEHAVQLRTALDARYKDVAWGSNSIHDLVD